MIVQQELNAERLVKEIRDLSQNPSQIDRMEEASRGLAHGDAAVTATNLIEELAGKRI
jgi:UDP-N-acetylglucosamine:LPS N-acetylglucosamine transferase